MEIRCICSDRQLEQVGCDCDAQVNVATSELNRRYDAEKATYDQQVNDLYAELERRNQLAFEAQYADEFAALAPADVSGKIIVRYSSVDGFSKTRTFKTIDAAKTSACEWVGRHPEIGRGYAVSGDGVGKVTVQGATIYQLFA